ncbi:MAG: ferrous iron transporter B [Bacillota bacterium]|jgi:ferrous iron transport protein B
MTDNKITIALAGNPNCGKTTLFNNLTGSNQFVGNWPGVTVEKKAGKLKQNPNIIITDLPGIYSLSPYTLEEVVARNYLVKESPDAILNIIDGTNPERNLYLTTQLLELGIPVIVAVNMMDIVKKNGDKINTDALAKALGVPVFEISALKGTGLTEAVNAVTEIAEQHQRVIPPHKFSGSVEHALAHIEEAVLHDLPESSQRWYAVKIFERDEKVIADLKIPPAALKHIEGDIAACEKEMDDEAEFIITSERYAYITSIIDKCYKKNAGRTLTTSDKIDRIVTNRWLSLPIFALVMFLVYYISVSTVGTLVTDWTNDGLFGDGWHLFGSGSAEYTAAYDRYVTENILDNTNIGNLLAAAAENPNAVGTDDLTEAVKAKDTAAFDEAYASYADSIGDEFKTEVDSAMENAPAPSEYGVWVPGIPVLAENALNAINSPEWLTSLLVGGVIGGVGAVLGFVPQMLVLFLFLAFLEYCGYMARVAFILDRIFRKFGLSGKSFIPMLIGSGCGVPGIMASRTIENQRDRRMTIITTTFIPCGAKMPIIALLAAAVFGGAWWVAPSAYFLGVAAVICSGIILKKTKMFAGEPAPFVMELPAYHMPTIGSILRSMWERGWSFIKRAGTIILAASILIWLGSSLGFTESGFGFGTDLALENSILGMAGSAIAWIFKPLGFGEPAATVATIMGLVAKEEVVAVFGVLDFENIGMLAGYSFLTFNLLCAPCFAAIGAIRREMNSAKWTWFAIGYQCALAYAAALCIYQFGLFFSGSVNIPGFIFALIVFVGFIYLLARPNKYEGKTAQLNPNLTQV